MWRVFSWLWRSRPRTDLRVVVYTRERCHLCDDAIIPIQLLQARYGFTLDILDIDADPDLVEKFGKCVPVVEINGKLRQRGRFNAALFQRELDAPVGS